MLIKTDIAGHDFNLALLEYRNTLVDGLASPAQLLMSRNLRSVVPCTKQLLTPKTIHHKRFRQNRIKQQSRQSKYHNRQSKELKPLQIGQPVRAQICGKLWQAGIVKRVDVNPRSYIIETTDGGTYRRNRRHIKTLNQQPQSPDLADHEEDSPEAKTSPAPISPPSLAPVPRVTPIETLPQPINFECSSALRTLPPAPSTSRPAQEEPQNSPYITRSGRLVKPIQRLDM